MRECWRYDNNNMFHTFVGRARKWRFTKGVSVYKNCMYFFPTPFSRCAFVGKKLIFFYQHSDTVSVGAIKWMATDHRNSPGKKDTISEATPFGFALLSFMF